MIGRGTEAYYGSGLSTPDSADWAPDYPVPRESPEKSVGKLVAHHNQISSLMFQANMRLALTLLGFMLLLNGLLVFGTVLLASSSEKTLQSAITKLLYKQVEI
jgi:hypothetical protein